MADVLAVGITIFISFFMIGRWLALPTLLVLLGRPMLVDLSISILVFVMFGGTLTGGAAAMLAAFMLSILLTFARRWIGYFDPKTKKLVRGHINIDDRLEKYSK
jgi:hypothetical protein